MQWSQLKFDADGIKVCKISTNDVMMLNTTPSKTLLSVDGWNHKDVEKFQAQYLSASNKEVFLQQTKEKPSFPDQAKLDNNGGGRARAEEGVIAAVKMFKFIQEY
eukprot:15365615-Ditylum_brightwellii.AAC.1